MKKRMSLKVLTLKVVLTFIVLYSCKPDTIESNFYNNCKIKELNPNSAIRITDTFGIFSICIPDTTWSYQRILEDGGNSVLVKNFKDDFIRVVNVTQRELDFKWDWEFEERKLEEKYKVLEKGKILINGNQARYSLIGENYDSAPLMNFFATIVDTKRKKYFNFLVTVDLDEKFKTRICEIKPIIESFRIITD